MSELPATPDSSAPGAPGLCRPKTLWDLFWSFTWLALQGFGGVLAVAQRELVERKRWMTREQFVEDWAVAHVMPGPNVINLSLMLGSRYFGWRGALVATLGMMLIPTLILMVLISVFNHYAEGAAVQGALRGMGAVAAGLIAATGLKLLPALRHNPMGLLVCAVLGVLVMLALLLLRWPLAQVLLLLGGAACLWAYRCLGEVAQHGAKVGDDDDPPPQRPGEAS